MPNYSEVRRAITLLEQVDIQRLVPPRERTWCRTKPLMRSLEREEVIQVCPVQLLINEMLPDDYLFNDDPILRRLAIRLGLTYPDIRDMTSLYDGSTGRVKGRQRVIDYLKRCIRA